MGMTFKKAERKQAKARVAFNGPPGSGKTMSALLMAKGLGGKVAVIDTERGSASLYSHIMEFDTLDLEAPYTPEKFIEAINAAASAKYDVLIIDSMTHEWDGAGGCLEINDHVANAKYKGNTWAAWNETTPRHRAFVDAILQAPMHVLATMRSKVETVQGEGKKVVKLGMKSIQRDGTDYEFTTVFDITHENHAAIASKDRTELFKEPTTITAETGKRLLNWLNSGAVVSVAKPAPAPKPAPQRESQVLADERRAIEAGGQHQSPPMPDDKIPEIEAIEEHEKRLNECQTIHELEIAGALIGRDARLSPDGKTHLRLCYSLAKKGLTTTTTTTKE